MSRQDRFKLVVTAHAKQRIAERVSAKVNPRSIAMRAYDYGITVTDAPNGLRQLINSASRRKRDGEIVTTTPIVYDNRIYIFKHTDKYTAVLLTVIKVPVFYRKLYNKK